MARCNFHLLTCQDSAGGKIAASPLDLVELLYVVPLGGVPGAAELSVAVIVQYGRDFDVLPVVIQESIPSDQPTSPHEMRGEGALTL